MAVRPPVRGRDDGGRRSFTYKPRTAEDVKSRANQSSGMFDTCYKEKYTVWGPKEGDQVIRPLPPTWDDARHYGIDVWVHSSVGPDNQSYLCPVKMNVGPCPVCEAREEAIRAGSEDPWLDEVKPYRRVLMWIIVRGEEEKGPQLYPMPWTLDRDFSAQAVDKQTGEVYLVDHPQDGYDLMFERKGTKMATKYVGPSIARRSSPLSDDAAEADAWLEFVTENPLPDTLNYYDYDYINKVFSGGASKKADDTPAEEPPPRTRAERAAPRATERPSPSTTRRPAPPPEEEEQQEEEEEEQQEEETPPVRTGRAKPVDDPDADLDAPGGEEEQEEEAEQAPPPSRRPLPGSSRERRPLRK